MPNPPRLTIVVPTIGRSPVLADCLAALAVDRQVDSELVVVIDESLDAEKLLRDIPDRVISMPPGFGFSTACNAAIVETENEFVAIVNDDVVVQPGWSEILMAALEEDSRLGAVQGVNLQHSQPERVDGCGITWNKAWQAVQIDRGSSELPDDTHREVYGVSGTAAMYSRRALADASLHPSEAFDPLLHTYYEDVDLAGRVRAKGYRAELIPSARAQHVGGASSSQDPFWRWRQIYGNRLLVLARLLGRSFWPRLPMIFSRDLIDLVRAVAHTSGDQVRGILAGWSRASGFSAEFRHGGPSLVPISDLRRFMVARNQRPER